MRRKVTARFVKKRFRCISDLECVELTAAISYTQGIQRVTREDRKEGVKAGDNASSIRKEAAPKQRTLSPVKAGRVDREVC